MISVLDARFPAQASGDLVYTPAATHAHTHTHLYISYHGHTGTQTADHTPSHTLPQ